MGGLDLAATGSLAIARHLEDRQVATAVSLVFARENRPDLSAISALAESGGAFTISHAPENGHRLELLVNGLTYDLVGLAPGEGAPTVQAAHAFGLPVDTPLSDYEMVTLALGPHLVGGAMMFPVVRAQAELAAHLCSLPGAVAVNWHPARSLSDVRYFREAVLRWIDGGAFPGLGLAALAPTEDGGLQSEGLTHFIGQELYLDPTLCEPRGDAAKVALRLMHWLVEHGTLEKNVVLTGPSGEPMQLIVNEGSGIVTAWRGGT